MKKCEIDEEWKVFDSKNEMRIPQTHVGKGKKEKGKEIREENELTRQYNGYVDQFYNEIAPRLSEEQKFEEEELLSEAKKSIMTNSKIKKKSKLERLKVEIEKIKKELNIY